MYRSSGYARIVFNEFASIYKYFARITDALLHILENE
jgi:hypothetical protein